ncbi:MAG: hypothetical protein H7Y42_08735 [Chitinophagaceae bacterium]|nr:hypothetical protein [Chitinophagaceae bacterium]
MFLMPYLKVVAVMFFWLWQFKGFAQSSMVVTDNALIPEGIAINPKNGDVFVSSIAKKKIIRISPGGEVVDFIAGDSSFLEGLGMKVDRDRNILWALSNIRQGKWFTSRIHGYDLGSRKSKYYYSYKDTLPHLLNDLILDKNGDLIITDTYSSTIYRFFPATQKLEAIINSPRLKWPNGLAFGKNERLYLATYGTGILQVDLDSKNIQTISGFKDSLIAYGLDGLVYEKGKLYGVYNADTAKTSHAVVVYTLDEEKPSVVSEVLLDKGNPDFFDPTTAALYKNRLYVIANSHLDEYNKNKESTKGIEHSLRPMKILVYEIGGE